MKEHGIIMNDPMALAVFEDRKTMTRRPVRFPLVGPYKFGKARPWTERDIPEINQSLAEKQAEYAHHRVPTPYGVPGDRLWIRECFALLRQDNCLWTGAPTEAPQEFRNPVFRADFSEREAYLHGGWYPSIHMPRWAARSIREIVSVRVERVQEISEADAWREGSVPAPEKPGDAFAYTKGFILLWDSICGTTEYAWVNNPPVWVYEFRRVAV